MFKQIAILPPRVTLVSDDTLSRAVYNALRQVKPLQLSRLPVRVQVKDGVVTLSGAIGSYAIKSQTLQAVRSLPGVKRVRDELWTDSELQMRVAQALATDPLTRPATQAIVVHVTNGTVALAGRVPDHAVAKAAVSVATSQIGVRAVSNRLQAP